MQTAGVVGAQGQYLYRGRDTSVGARLKACFAWEGRQAHHRQWTSWLMPCIASLLRRDTVSALLLEGAHARCRPWSGSPPASHVWHALPSATGLQVQRLSLQATISACCTTGRHAHCRPILSATPCAQNAMRVMNIGTGRKPSRTTGARRRPEPFPEPRWRIAKCSYDRCPTGSGAQGWAIYALLRAIPHITMLLSSANELLVLLLDKQSQSKQVVRCCLTRLRRWITHQTLHTWLRLQPLCRARPNIHPEHLCA